MLTLYSLYWNLRAEEKELNFDDFEETWKKVG